MSTLEESEKEDHLHLGSQLESSFDRKAKLGLIEEEHAEIYKLYEKILTTKFNLGEQASLRRLAKKEQLQDAGLGDSDPNEDENFKKVPEAI